MEEDTSLDTVREYMNTEEYITYEWLNDQMTDILDTILKPLLLPITVKKKYSDKKQLKRKLTLNGESTVVTIDIKVKADPVVKVKPKKTTTK